VAEGAERRDRRGPAAAHSTARSTVGAVAALSLTVALGAGCQTTITDSSGRRVSRPEPTRVGPAPAGTRARQMMLVAGVPNDSDGNGFPDTVPVVVYLFAPVDEYPLPLIEPGEFRFELTDRSGERVGLWSFSEALTANSAQELPPGSGYVFGLRMAPGVDRRRNEPAALTAVFTASSDGRTVTSSGSATVRIGAGNPGAAGASSVDGGRAPRAPLGAGGGG